MPLLVGPSRSQPEFPVRRLVPVVLWRSRLALAPVVLLVKVVQ
jgi:hypothetical protein